jgi:hypothetical protein
MHHRIPRLALRSLAACLPAAALLLAFGTTAGASTIHHPTAAQRAAAIARSEIRHLVIGQHPTDHRASAPRVASGHLRVTGSTPVNSTNWSGYADTGTNFTKVTGNWTEPSFTCTSALSLAAFWVGIDGYSSSSVEQDGTLVECYGGTAYQYSWWEMYPTNDIQVVGESVASGDSIAASVVRSGTSYTLKVTDSTHTANSFTTTQTCSTCANSSAEWIAEAPSGASGVYPLTDFHTWTESGATVATTTTSGVISTFPNYEITMVNGSGLVKAQPGPLNAAGNGFSVTWERSS